MPIVVLITAKDGQEAQKLADSLVEGKLAACANIVDNIHSVFTWQGKVDREKEALLILKSKNDLFPKIVERVKSLHSYEVPEIIALPVVEGSQDYLNWIEENCG